MWGVHLNNHFDISLAMVAQAAAAAPGRLNALDTHYMWQDGQHFATHAPVFEDGYLAVKRTSIGLGIELDRQRVAAAHKLYVENDCGTRDDTAAMQFLIPNWEFDAHRPVCVRS